ncbi:MAG: recombination-associated protein RdgC [Gammaproteobacteria bacterium]|nr:recombination-associated protein RdgC [Gammaproteobacteria bacterium]
MPDRFYSEIIFLMLFRNCQVFRFSKQFSLTSEQLESQLTEQLFIACGSQQTSSYGWVEPLGKTGQMLTHTTDNRIMLCARKEERLLPASVIREEVEQQIETIETEQDRRVFPSERRRLKDEAVMHLLPKAFTKSQLTYAYIDLDLQLLIVDASSRKRAEELTILLRKTLGTLPVIPPLVKQSPANVMSNWLLKSSFPEGLEAGAQCELRDISDSATVLRSKGLDLHSDEFLSHISTGMQVIKLELQWKENCQLIMHEDLSITRLRFSDILREPLKDLDKDDIAGRFDTDFAIMGGEIAQLLPELFEAFGGIEQS